MIPAKRTRALLVAVVSALALVSVTGSASAVTTSVWVVGWGDNSFGQSSQPAGLTGVTAIAAGGVFNLALKDDGSVVAWGQNFNGQTDVPAGLSDVTAISAGMYHSLALKEDGTVVAWGYDQDGETDVPAGLSDVVAVSAGGFHNLALKNDGTVVAWGSNSHGQATVPSGLGDVVAVSAGGFFSLALKNDGTVVAWGWDLWGATTPPADLSEVIAISAGELSHALALKADGTVVAWGRNFEGQANVPAGLAGVTAIDAGGAHSLAVKNDGTVVAWGWDLRGQTNVPAWLTGVTAIAGGYEHSLALTTAPPPDRTPPVIIVPAAITINATSPAGAVAEFTATATDKNPAHPVVTCSPSSGSVFAIGTTTVFCTATDAAGNTANAHFTVYVKGAVEQLTYLHHTVIGVGPGSSLADKVQHAQTLLSRHDVAGACGILNAFINQVTTQTGKSIAPDTATALIADASRIRAVLGC